MSVHEIGQRWLATMGMSDEQIEMRAERCSRARRGMKRRRKRDRRGPRKSCGYCQAPGPHPCAECQAAVLALRAFRGRGVPKVQRRESKAPVESAHVMALVDEIEPLPLVPHLGYVPRGTSARRSC